MLTWFIERVFFAESPLVWFLGLVIITQIIYHYFFTQRMPSIGGSAVVMALGVVAVYLLPLFNMPLWLMTLVSLELMIVWLYFAVNYMQIYAQDELTLALATDRLSLGCWVAGTLATGLLLEEADPLLYGCIIMLALIGLVSLGAYLYLLWHPWWAALHRLGRPVSGRVMLPSIASTLMILLILELFHDDMPACLECILILGAAGLCLLGLLRLVWFWFKHRSLRLLLVWPNANTLIYGALATLGLSMIHAGLFDDGFVLSYWCMTVAVFAAITALECCRAYWRWQQQGLVRGFGRYHPSAWFRVYALTMVVVFTNEAWNLTPVTSSLMDFISNKGSVIVMLVMFVQLFLMVRARARWPR
jgi:hypothetical protein